MKRPSPTEIAHQNLLSNTIYLFLRLQRGKLAVQTVPADSKVVAHQLFCVPEFTVLRKGKISTPQPKYDSVGRTKARQLICLHVFGLDSLAAGLEQKPHLPLCKCSLSGNSERAVHDVCSKPSCSPELGQRRLLKTAEAEPPQMNQGSGGIRSKLSPKDGFGWHLSLKAVSMYCKDLICNHTPTQNWMLLHNRCLLRCQIHYTHAAPLAQQDECRGRALFRKNMKTQCHHEQHFSVPPASTGSARVFLSHTF